MNNRDNFNLKFLNKMKIKSILVSMLAVAALASCSNDDGGGSVAPEMGTFEVVLPSVPGTRAVDDVQAPGTVTPTYADVATYLVDGGGNYVKHEWTADEITAKSKRFEQIVKPAKVVVVANKGNIASLPEKTTEAGLKTVMNTLAIENQNSGLAKVTLMGECLAGSFTSETPTDGHTLFKATVALTSLVSRFEVGTVKAGTGLTNIAVQAVYLNYFYNTYEMNTFQGYTQSTWPGDAFTPIWATDAGDADVTSVLNTKCYAYQVFTGNLVPHIIYKVSGEVSEGYKLSDGTTGVFSGKYITVKGFKVGSDALVGTTANAGQYQMKVNEIYKMGLTDGGIVITPEQITPDPEMDKVDLIVEVTVVPWTAQNVTPEI